MPAATAKRPGDPKGPEPCGDEERAGLSESAPLKRTPLHDVHVALGARMIEFAGWSMPVQYTSVLAEHRAVRAGVGLFDLSHMGEFALEGPAAEESLQRLLTNDVASLPPGRAHYTLLLNEDGGVVDDVILYRLGADRFMLVVNAANTAKDREWIRSRLKGRIAMEDQSDETALLAVQGPRAEAVVSGLLGRDLSHLPGFAAEEVELDGVPVLLSRTGYTGEDGFELYCSSARAQRLWERLLEAGKGEGIVPVGLGARDTLRLEARYPLYGNELTEQTTPFEAGLGFAVKLDKGEFTGREALLAQKARGVARRLVGFEMVERGIPRKGYPLFAGERPVGEVTSGSFSPTLERDIGLGYVAPEFAAPGSELEVEIRGQRKRAKVIQGRFVPIGTKKS